MSTKKKPASKGKAKARKTNATKSKSTPRRGGAPKTRTERAVFSTSTAKNAAMKVLAGAAAGAVRAMVPPLEEAAAKLSPAKKSQASVA